MYLGLILVIASVIGIFTGMNHHNKSLKNISIIVLLLTISIWVYFYFNPY